ncbi:shTK domain protein [Teladorsagia circumcincta]|uniref:ShTK domain protein n=1 Tax=Teladorsagia circumcincta TaxID=45464 RepID=A0A2G9V4Y0_TELCI|nr:shTK domain protein [Teladorsagia circumcincta]
MMNRREFLMLFLWGLLKNGSNSNARVDKKLLKKVMLYIILSSTLLFGSVWAQMTNLNCTEIVGGAPKYAPSAVNCENKLSDANCAILYPTNPVKVNTNTERDPKCGGAPPTVDPQLVQTAIDLCPKTCGFCCLTPAYLCQDKQRPRIPCSSVTKGMCGSPAWKPILQEDCPKTCGLCDTGSCVDEAPGCNVDGGLICQSKNLETFAQRYCKKTCGFCPGSTNVPGTGCGSDPK